MEKSIGRTRRVPKTKEPAVRRLAFGFAGCETMAVSVADGAVVVRVGAAAGFGARVGRELDGVYGGGASPADTEVDEEAGAFVGGSVSTST